LDNIRVRNDVRKIKKFFATAQPSLTAYAGGDSYPLGAGDSGALKVDFHPDGLGEGVTSVNFVLIAGSPPPVSQGLLKNLNNRKNVRESRHHEERSDFKSGY
jgi:hypothetical protein